jgi:tetratricopeptide (TPR) repeat protein
LACGQIYGCFVNIGLLRTYTKALELAPEDQEVHLNLGLVEEKTGRATRAVERFKKAFNYSKIRELICQVIFKKNIFSMILPLDTSNMIGLKRVKIFLIKYPSMA